MINSPATSNVQNDAAKNPFEYTRPMVDHNMAVAQITVVDSMVNQVFRREHLSILAPRQSGKTTLLLQINDRMKEIKTPDVIYIPLKGVGISEFPMVIEQFVECVGDTRVRVDIPEVDFYPRRFMKLLQEWARKGPIIFLVDELPEKQEPAYMLLAAIRAYHNDRLFRDTKEAGHIFIFAGSQDLADLSHDVDPYMSPFNIAVEVMLTDFTDSETLEFIQRVGRGLIPESPGQKIYNYTRGHPFFVQYVCHQLWDKGEVEQEHLLSNVHTLVKELELEGTNNIQGMMNRFARDASGLQQELRFLRRILQGEKIAFAHSHRIVRNLLMQGAIREEDGFCTIRNPIYEVAFWNYFRVHDVTDEGRAQIVRRYEDFFIKLKNFDGWVGVEIQGEGSSIPYNKEKYLYTLQSNTQYELRIIIASGMKNQQSFFVGLTQDIPIKDGEDATDSIEYTVRPESFYNFAYGEEQSRTFPPTPGDVMQTYRFPFVTHEKTKEPVQLFINVYQSVSLIQVLRLQIQIMDADIL